MNDIIIFEHVPPLLLSYNIVYEIPKSPCFHKSWKKHWCNFQTGIANKHSDLSLRSNQFYLQPSFLLPPKDNGIDISCKTESE